MQAYLRSHRLAGFMNILGLRVLIAMLAQGWFILLWGLTVPAMTAGLALGVLGQLGLTRFRRENAAAKEAALRRRLGGECRLEELLLMPPADAHRTAAELLRLRYPELTIERADDDGALCRWQGERLLVVCPAQTPQSELSADAAARIGRACRAAEAARGIVCLTGKCSREAAAWAETGPVVLRFFSRETMLALAGAAHPVTDEQLAALGARKKRPAPGGWTRSVLLPGKAKRYMMYGVALMLLYVVTGLKYYPAPGAVCMVLATLCRCVRPGPEAL